MDMQSIIEELRRRGRNMVSLDTPQDSDLADMGIDFAAGFAPGVGTALSARDFERARREGDVLGMGLSTLGMVPVVGGVPRTIMMAAKKGGKGKKAVLRQEDGGRRFAGDRRCTDTRFPSFTA